MEAPATSTGSLHVTVTNSSGNSTARLLNNVPEPAIDEEIYRMDIDTAVPTTSASNFIAPAATQPAAISAPESDRLRKIAETVAEVVAGAGRVDSPQPAFQITYTLSPEPSPSTSYEYMQGSQGQQQQQYITLGAPARLQGFEDLPDNFLENVISPNDQQYGQASAQQQFYIQSGHQSSPGPTLANLTPVTLVDGSSNHNQSHFSDASNVAVAHTTAGLTPLIPMTVTSAHSHQQHTYLSAALKMEPPDPRPPSRPPNASTLLSPLQLAPLQTHLQQGVEIPSGGGNTVTLPPMILQQNGGYQYVKVEVAGGDLAPSQTHLAPGQGAKTVDIAHNLLANMFNTNPSAVSTKRGTIAMVPSSSGQVEKVVVGGRQITSTTNQHSVGAGRKGARRRSSVPDELDCLDDDDIYIDTKDLCRRIAYELKQHSIPQAIFAERILCRSQGTLSDLLRNPKPWNKLKSGRETFRRMYAWLQQPLPQRLATLELWKAAAAQEIATANKGASVNLNGDGDLESVALDHAAPQTSELDASAVRGGISIDAAEPLSPPAGAGDGSETSEPRRADSEGLDDDRDHNSSVSKRPRLVFTDIQKRTLQAIFKETQRPSREMQQTIAEHLGLDLSTVQNFFMNARRRSRLAPQYDLPAPNQQVRPITPPPRSPPPGHLTFSRGKRKQASSAVHHHSSADTVSSPEQPPRKMFPRDHPLHLAHIEDTVASVVGQATHAYDAPTPPALQGTELNVNVQYIIEDHKDRVTHFEDISPVRGAPEAGGASPTARMGLSGSPAPSSEVSADSPGPYRSASPQKTQVASAVGGGAATSTTAIMTQSRHLPVMSFVDSVQTSPSLAATANNTVGSGGTAGNQSPKKRLLLRQQRTLTEQQQQTGDQRNALVTDSTA